MTLRRHLVLFTSVLTAVTPMCSAAIACGPPPAGPAFIDVFGGETPDLNAFYDGRVGLVTEESPRAKLFMDWRLLHGLPVGRAAGAALSLPCCGNPDPDTWDATEAWQQERNTVPGVAQSTGMIETDVPVGQDASYPNCFGAAFTNATDTLKARIASYGATSPWVKAWVLDQDMVFQACNGTKVALPPLDAAAPAWAKADYAYQAAAVRLYSGDNAGAAMAFTAIGADAGSPWRPMGRYLTARALVREAQSSKTPQAYVAAETAVAALAAAPAGTFGQGDARGMQHAMLFRQDPARATASLQKALLGPSIDPTAAADFKDFYALNHKASPQPEVVDWIMTIKGQVAGSPAWVDTNDDTATVQTKRAQAIAQSLAHARAMWAKTKDEAWLVAALTLVDPRDPAAAALGADAGRVQPSSPAYITALYHRIRITMLTAPQAETRAALDQALARKDLTTSERNLFIAERMQVAENEQVFARLALRRVLCADSDDKSGCVRSNYNDEAEEGILLDKDGKIGLGGDAMALIDRLPLAQRAALVSDADLPTTIRLDIGLTTFTRAVLEQNNGVIDSLAGQLAVLLPQLAPQWKQVVATAPGPDKRFAEFFILAQIPGMSTDLTSYTRPEGTIPQFQGNWQDWMILPAGATNGDYAPPCLLTYNPDGYCGDDQDGSDKALWATSDVVCQTYCGEGAFAMRRPDFMAATLKDWQIEQTRLAKPWHDDKGRGASVWDEVLAWASAHPKDARSPEALYWLIHVARYGQSHKHLSHRAFDILHGRYPTSTWAKKTPYYFD